MIATHEIAAVSPILRLRLPVFVRSQREIVQHYDLSAHLDDESGEQLHRRVHVHARSPIDSYWIESPRSRLHEHGAKQGGTPDRCSRSWQRVGWIMGWALAVVRRDFEVRASHGPSRRQDGGARVPGMGMN